MLPEAILKRIERQAVTFSEHSARLLAAGRHLKRGLLFHGPPGTGKTLTAMDLAAAFIRELLRKAALYSADESDGDGPIAVADRQLDEALDELVIAGGRLTQRLLGGVVATGLDNPPTGSLLSPDD